MKAINGKWEIWLLMGNAFYLCPSSNPGKSYCNLPNHYYCAYWGCETIASNWDVAIKDRFLNIIWGPRGCNPPAPSWDGHIDGPHLGNCKHVILEILQPNDHGWLLGRTWGMRYWESGTDGGGLILIQKREVKMPQAVGPNRVLTKPKVKKKRPKIENSTISVTTGTNQTPVNKTEEAPKDSEPLWAVMQAAYQALNATNPNFTISCWLCYDVKPPFYEGVAVPSPFDTSTEDNPSRCNWKERKVGITLQQVRGSGWCIGKITNGRKALCTNQTQNFTPDIKWVFPSPGAWWICSITGLTPCLSTTVFSKEYL
uniref:Uncharacterized protein n=1 Tax=Calidris pygmaea TaxID=425635 RepID=A0A8C3J7Y7_9CHAR